MQLLLEKTDILTTIDGVPVRLWKGTTDTGLQVSVFVHRIVVEQNMGQLQLERELELQSAPREFLPLVDALMSMR